MKEFVVLYILYPNLENPSEVLYLKKIPKKKAPKLIWNKLVGIGGEIEKIDGDEKNKILNASIRETKEELGINIRKEKLIYCGKIYIKSQNRIIHFLKIGLDKKIPISYIKNEGHCKYYKINYHQKKPKEFPPEDTLILDKVFFSDSNFDETID